MNPLNQLCEQLGLTPEGLADAASLDVASVWRALNDEPEEPLATFLKCAQSLGVRMRLHAARKPFALWIMASAVDALHRNNAWRKSVGLAALPPDRGQLVAFIRFARKRHKWSYGDIKEHLERNFIPTMEGLSNWRGGTIGQIVNGGKVIGTTLPLGYAQEFQEKFRRHVMQELMARMCAFDPFASVRYQIDWSEQPPGYLVFEATHPMPECAARWMVEGVKKLGWFGDGQWGCDAPPCALGTENNG